MWLGFGCNWLTNPAFVVGSVYNNQVIANSSCDHGAMWSHFQTSVEVGL